MSYSAPTILRTENKLGDYLSKPDLAKFKLPNKMSRPWIVNTGIELDKIKTSVNTDNSVDKADVFRKIKEKKNEKRKFGGGNRKFVRNIHEIIADDNSNTNTVTDTTTTNTNSTAAGGNWNKYNNMNYSQKKSNVVQHDAMNETDMAPVEINHNNCQDNDAEMEEKQRNLARDIELEQQQIMNRMYNNPSTFESTYVPGGLIPVMVNNPAGGYYIVHLPLHPLPPNVVAEPSYHPISNPSTSSSASPTPADEGFVDGYDSNDDHSSLAETFDNKLEISDEFSDEESEENDELKIKQDEELNRLVSSIIDED